MDESGGDCAEWLNGDPEMECALDPSDSSVSEVDASIAQTCTHILQEALKRLESTRRTSQLFDENAALFLRQKGVCLKWSTLVASWKPFREENITSLLRCPLELEDAVPPLAVQERHVTEESFTPPFRRMNLDDRVLPLRPGVYYPVYGRYWRDSQVYLVLFDPTSSDPFLFSLKLQRNLHTTRTCAPLFQASIPDTQSSPIVYTAPSPLFHLSVRSQPRTREHLQRDDLYYRITMGPRNVRPYCLDLDVQRDLVWSLAKRMAG
ncbi:hypothetical protein BDK51DRAFT_51982 [Blyttiomyces helicus]|uniref:Uncharacterized protein n=1 Tax=Blyttiomyces helicus TaxID=388810 RepID=A0A4P9WHL1_9FUNG|nr:hypothetical protein BDK51DRAFT_51982 [Blyttiomyces helicus]|eukprot:RKO91435.1 hypothetical protein BDK51DRAFT_51982 [Blyttiomyces helicus]